MVLRERNRPALSRDAILPTTNESKECSSLNNTFVKGPFSRVINSVTWPSSRMKALCCILIIAIFLIWMLFKIDILSWGGTITNASRVKPIFFVHFHRSGGTGVCKTLLNSTSIIVTDAEGLTQDPELNCHTALSGPKQNPEQFYRIQTCRHLIPYTLDDHGIPFHRNNFIALQVPFLEEMPCPGDYRSFSIMRDPIDRLASHLHSEGFHTNDLHSWAKDRTRTPPDSWMHGYPVVNSMVIRQLLGQDRFVDPRPVDKHDLERAKRAVDRFDVFVPLEYLKDPKVLHLLKKTLPEYYEPLMRLGINETKTKREWPKPSGSDLGLMERENKFDIMLYQYVLEKLEIQ